MAVLTDLQTAVSGYAAALAADASSPQPSYSIDGQSVSRQEWRDGTLKMIIELNKVIVALDPYVIATKQVL